MDEIAMHGKAIDILGMQVCSIGGDPYRVTECLDVARKYRKPLWVMDLQDFLSGTGFGWQKMNKVTQSAIQHGADGIFYYCWHGTAPTYSFYPDFRVDDMNRMLTQARAARKLVDGMTIRSKVALIQPMVPYCPQDPFAMMNERMSFMGWYKTLENMHQTFDVVTLREIEEGRAKLGSYEWILVPDCAYIQRPALDRLMAYARGSGHLITSGRFAQFDEAKRPLAPKTGDLRQHVLALPDYGKEYAGVLGRDNAPYMYEWRNETRAKRRVSEDAIARLSEYLRRQGIQSDAALIGADDTVRMTTFTGTSGQAVYLVDMGEQTSHGLRLRVRSDGLIRCTAYADTAMVDCRGVYDLGWTEVTLPDFETSCIVRLDR